MHVPRPCALLALLFGALAAIAPAAQCAGPPVTLHELVEQAWQRSSAARSLPARRLEAEATRQLSASWLAGQPVLGLSQRSDRSDADRGLAESEVSIAATLQMPGQRAARRSLAERSAAELQAQTRKAHLDVAGEVRARLWDAAGAQALLEEKQGHLRHTIELADEVTRRAAAGDLARVDALLAEQEVQAARIAVDLAAAEAQRGAARLQALTGYTGALPLSPEAVPPDAGAEHPSLLAARAQEERAQAAQRLAGASRNAPPTVTLSVRRERDLALAAPERSLGVALQIPFGGAGRNRPLEAQAQAQAAVIGAEADQTAANLDAELASARTDLAHAKAALATARARIATLAEHRALIERAFRLGERGLADLLRAHALTHEAEVAARQQEIHLGRAHAQLNQAAGVLP